MRKLIAAVVGIGALAILPGSGAQAVAGPLSHSISPTARALAASARATRRGTVTEIPLGSNAQVYLFGLAAGPDGNVWFADQGCMGLGHCAIGRLTPQGRFTSFARGLNPGSLPFTVVAGADGNVWFTDDGRRPAIGRITPQGNITEFSRGLRHGSQPFELTATPGGDVWFTDQGAHPALGRITLRGKITEFGRGLGRRSKPFGIATGTDGQVWFTDRGCSSGGRCAVGRVTSTGHIAEVRHGLRLRNVDRVAALHFDDTRLGTLRHGALRGGRDHPIIGRDEIPAWLAAPRGLRDRAIECLQAPGHL